MEVPIYSQATWILCFKKLGVVFVLWVGGVGRASRIFGMPSLLIDLVGHVFSQVQLGLNAVQDACGCCSSCVRTLLKPGWHSTSPYFLGRCNARGCCSPCVAQPWERGDVMQARAVVNLCSCCNSDVHDGCWPEAMLSSTFHFLLL